MEMTKFVRTWHPRAPHRRLAVLDYVETAELEDIPFARRIKAAWDITKSPLGYTSYTSIYIATRTPYAKIFGVLKWLHRQYPYSIGFNVSRLGQNVYFKLIPEKLPPFLRECGK